MAIFSSQTEVTQILKNRDQLKGTGYVIEKDLAENWRKRKNKMLAIRKEILKRDKSVKPRDRRDHLVVEGEGFDRDEEEGLLCSEGEESTSLTPKKL